MSRNGRDASTINLQTGPTYLGSLTVGGVASDVTIDGFTIRGRDAANPVLAATNILVNPGVHDVTITNNRLRVGVIDGGSNGDDGIGIETTYLAHGPRPQPVRHGQPVRALERTGTRAFYVNPGTDGFTFTGNSITGNFQASAVTQARNGLVEHNSITGTGTSAHLRHMGLPGRQPIRPDDIPRQHDLRTSLGFRLRPDQ